MKLFFTLFFQVYSCMLFSKVISHQSIESRLKDYSYEDFCRTMGAKSLFMIDVVDANTIECFNEKFNISRFCLKKLPIDELFTRGFSQILDKKVYCEVASSVKVTLTCDSLKQLCKDPFESCLKLKKIYAYRLDITHTSIINKNLNCYFSRLGEDNIDEI